MNKKTLFPLVMAALLAGCSSNEDVLSDGNNENLSKATNLVVKESGVSDVPLVATQGTTEVTVEYTSGGVSQKMNVPFTTTSTQANGALVSGHVQLYSSTPTCINVYNGDRLIGENIQLAGTVYEKSTVTRAGAAKTGEATAYYVVRMGNATYNESWGNINDEEPAYMFQPYHDMTGHVSSTEYSVGTVNVEGVDWDTFGSAHYKYSSDGSAVAPILATVPDVFAHQGDFGFLNYSEDNYKVIWYKVRQSGTDEYTVYGYLTEKSTSEVTAIPYDKQLKNSRISAPVNPDEPSADQKKEDGIYHNGGVVMYAQSGNAAYNDLVVDYDVEARFPKADGQYPYIKVAMHLRAMSNACSLHTVGINFKGLQNFVCPTDDMYITFNGVNVKDLDATYPQSVKNTELKPLVEFTGDGVGVYVKGLQWILDNHTPGWYDTDAHGCYNLTQETFNGQPFATLNVMLYPKNESSESSLEAAVASVLDVAQQSILFNGEAGTCIIAPTGTPHVAEPNTFGEAFPKYPSDNWWTNHTDGQNYDATKVVNMNK